MKIKNTAMLLLEDELSKNVVKCLLKNISIKKLIKDFRRIIKNAC